MHTQRLCSFSVLSDSSAIPNTVDTAALVAANDQKSLNCTTCKGSGTFFSKGFTSLDGKVYPDSTNPCSSCDGVGNFPPLDEGVIRALILATKGRNKGRIRASMTSSFSGDVNAARAYYVWRLARFHGGVDTRMPVLASLGSRGDPTIKALDALADAVAKEQFGSNMRAAAQWGRALGYL